MKVNLKEWKKVDSSTTHVIMQNKDGHELRISKEKLSHEMREQLGKLPTHMKDGGEVKKPSPSPSPPEIDKKKADEFVKGFSDPDPIVRKARQLFGMAEGGQIEDQGVPVEQPAPAPQAQPSVNINIASPQPQPQQNIVNPAELMKAMMGPVSAQAKEGMQHASPMQAQGLPPELQQPQASAQGLSGSPEAPQAPQPMPSGLASGLAPGATPQAPSATPAAPNALGSALEEKALNLQKQGIYAEAKAQGQLGQEEAKILEESAKSQQKVMGDYEKRQGEIDRMHAQMVQQLQEGKIDPNRYWENKSTAGKVGTVIGLILGGGAAGYLGKDNLALETLNKEIDRDIIAQKENLGNKNNLLHANLQYLRDTAAAAATTKAMQLDYASTQLKIAGAKSQDPIAKARAMQAAGPIDLLAAQYRKAAAIKSTMSDLERTAQADPSKIGDYLAALEQVNPEKAKEMRGRMVPGVGFAPTDADAKDLKEGKGDLDNAVQGIKRLKEINKIPGKSLNTSLRAEAESIQQTLVGLLRKPITGPGAMNEGERRLIENLVANPTKLMSIDKSNQIRLDTLQKKLEGSFSNMLSSRGLKSPNKETQLPPQQQSFAKWARQNLNSKDPATAQKARLVLDKLGLQ